MLSEQTIPPCPNCDRQKAEKREQGHRIRCLVCGTEMWADTWKLSSGVERRLTERVAELEAECKRLQAIIDEALDHEESYRDE